VQVAAKKLLAKLRHQRAKNSCASSASARQTLTIHETARANSAGTLEKSCSGALLNLRRRGSSILLDVTFGKVPHPHSISTQPAWQDLKVFPADQSDAPVKLSG